jgi:hypothetical protein
MKYPAVMCRWRALAQLSRFLFADLFSGVSVYTPDEAEEAAAAERFRLRNGAEQAEQAADPEAIDYGDDPELAGWLIALISAVNDLEPGRWLPKKVALEMKGKTQEQREQFAQGLVKWIEGRNGVVPERLSVIDATVEEEGDVSDDPGAHLNGETQEIDVD